MTTTVTGQFGTSERWEYSVIATNILEGRGASYPYLKAEYYFYGSAVYPRLLAAVLWASHGSEAAMLVFQALLFACTCLIIFGVAREMCGITAATGAGLIAALHPGALIYSGRLHAQTLDVFLIVLTFRLLLGIDRDRRLLAIVGSGIVAGLAVASRGTMLGFYALWAVWFVVRKSRPPLETARIAGGLALGGILALSPILLDGYRRHARLIPLRTDSGVNFWIGNHPGASGTSHSLSDDPKPVMNSRPPALAEGILGMNEVEQNAAFAAAALDFIRNDPAAFLTLFAKKLKYFWWFSPHTGLLYPATWTTLYRIYYATILVLASIGFGISASSKSTPSRTCTQVFLLLAGAISVSQALFYVEGRHRWQIEPLLLVFATGGAVRLYRAAVVSVRSEAASSDRLRA